MAWGSGIIELIDRVLVQPHLIAIRKDLEALSNDVHNALLDQQETKRQVGDARERLAALEAKFEQAERAAIARIQAGAKP